MKSFAMTIIEKYKRTLKVINGNDSMGCMKGQEKLLTYKSGNRP